MKTLTREKGLRMWGGGGSVTNGAGSSGGGDGVPASWVEQNYVSKAFWSSIFQLRGTKTTTVGSGTPTVESYVFAPNELPATVTTETDGVTTTVVTAITDIKVLGGLWTESYLSALGQGSGGGGGGASALTDLLDVAISNPTNGQVLMYNSTTGKWYNGTVQSGGGSVTSITAGTGLSGGTITSSGTIAINSTYQTYISHGETAYGWGNHANAGYLTSSDISDMATKTWVGQQGFVTSSGVTSVATGTGLTGGPITGSGTISINSTYQAYISNGNTAYGWGNHANAGYLTGITSSMVTSALGYTPLSNATTFWGQTVNSSNQVKGNMSSVGTISASGNITVTKTSAADTSVSVTNSNGTIYLLTSGNRGLYSDNDWVVGYNGTNTFLNKGNVGIGTTSPTYKLDVNGTMRIIGAEACDITTARNNNSAITTNAPYSLSAIRHALSFKWYNSDWQIGNMRSGGAESAGFAITEGSDKLAFRVYNGGTTYGYITQAYGGIRIGDGLLMWDSTNNALKVLKSDGTAANLYATGAVSALGFSAGTSSVDAMTFGYLTVNTQLNLPTTIVAGSSPMIARTASDSDCVYMFYSSAYSKVTGNTYYCNQYDNVGLRGTDSNYDDQWWIDPDGCARFRRLYLDATRYLYVSGSTLYFYNGSSRIQIA